MSEPRGKVDANGEGEGRGPGDGCSEAAVNGPEGEVLDWLSIDWAVCEERVRRLRQRIFKAAQDEDLKRVRNLQRLMLRSHRNTLVSVRRGRRRSGGGEEGG